MGSSEALVVERKSGLRDHRENRDKIQTWEKMDYAWNGDARHGLNQGRKSLGAIQTWEQRRIMLNPWPAGL